MYEQHTIIIKGEKTRTQIARELGISLRGLYNYIERAGIQLPAGTVKAASQRQIYDRLGAEALEEEEYSAMMRKSKWPYA